MGENIPAMGKEPEESVVADDHIKFGCVFFDDPMAHTAGSASVEGETPFRISGTGDLDSDVIWIINVGPDHMASAGFNGHARFRPANFLRTDINKLADFVGLAEENPGTIAQVLSVMIANTVKITEAMFGKTFVPDIDLKKSIRILLSGPDASMPEFAYNALQEATVYWTPVERTSSFADPGTVQRRIFQVPPARLLNRLGNLAVPFGNKWKRLSKTKIKGVVEDYSTLEDIIGGPFLAKVSLTNIDKQFNSILNFGAGATRGKREWVSSAELQTLMDIADVDIKQLIVPEKHQFVYHGVFDKIAKHEAACNLALSYNLFLENLWCALASTRYPTRKRFSPPVKFCMNPTIPFIRAIDRDLCMHAALQIEKAGFDVFGYGVGGVYVQVTGDETTEDYMHAAIESGTIPPVHPKNPEVDVEATIKDMESPLHILQALHLNNDRQNIIDIDHQVTEALT